MPCSAGWAPQYASCFCGRWLWQPGWLDIHHLAIGRGNATLVIFPDGTSLLIDAGAASGGADVSAAVRPDAPRRAGEWVGRHVQRHLRDGNLAALDDLLATHLHPDHVGDVGPRRQQPLALPDS